MIGGWISPPLFTPPVKVKSLTSEAVETALYIASPAGLSQLTVVLHARDYAFTQEQLVVKLNEVTAAGKAFSKSHNGAWLWALNGLGAGL